ncbi:MAG: hypothetical protein IKD86_04300 [Firmicutes bacterium]|nr:hypothetical protein [Bacillota bacterium]
MKEDGLMLYEVCAPEPVGFPGPKTKEEKEKKEEEGLTLSPSFFFFVIIDALYQSIISSSSQRFPSKCFSHRSGAV